MESVNVNEFYQAGLTFNIQDLDRALPGSKPVEEMTLAELEAAQDDDLEGLSSVGEIRTASRFQWRTSEELCDTAELTDSALTYIGHSVEVTVGSFVTSPERIRFLATFTALANANTVATGVRLIIEDNADELEQFADGMAELYDGDLDEIISQCWALRAMSDYELQEHCKSEFSVEVIEYHESGRWGHYAEAHVEEMDNMRRLYATLDAKGVDYDAGRYHGEARADRFKALVRFVERCTDAAKIARAQQGAYKRFSAAMKACAQRASNGNPDWSTLYLTKEQMSAFAKLCQARIRALK